MEDFFNSNFFQTLVIFVTGCFIFGVIKYNQYVEIRKYASIILMEVRDIEDNFANFMVLHNIANYYATTPIIVSNNWERSKHLFVSRLDQDDFKQINNFYSVVSEIEKERILLREASTEVFMTKSIYMQRAFIEIAKSEHELNNEQYDKKLENIAQKVFRSNPMFEADQPKLHINNLVKSFVPISTTISLYKLKDISNKKVLVFF